MYDEEGKGLFDKLKEKTSKHLDKASSVAEKVQTMRESATDKMSDIKDGSGEHFEIAKELASIQGSNWKSEAQFIKKILQCKDLVFLKTDTLAIVLRKFGGNEEFLAEVEKLTREGYRLVHHENVRNIPIPGGFDYPLGNLYYFQNVKYIDNSSV
ncbi:MAG: hypothetical protein ACREA7_10185 [Nitrosotalea sp.]